MAPPRQLSVPHLPARQAAEGRVLRARGAPGRPALGRTDVALHHPVATTFQDSVGWAPHAPLTVPHTGQFDEGSVTERSAIAEPSGGARGIRSRSTTGPVRWTIGTACSSERPTPTVPDIDLRAAFRCTPRRSSGNPESLSISPHRGWPGSALLAHRAHLVNQGQSHCAGEHSDEGDDSCLNPVAIDCTNHCDSNTDPERSHLDGQVANRADLPSPPRGERAHWHSHPLGEPSSIPKVVLRHNE